MHVGEVERFVSAKNIGQISEHFVIVEMCGEILPMGNF